MKKLLYILLFVPLAFFGQTYPQIGDVAYGGIVFHLDNNGDKILVVSSEEYGLYSWEDAISMQDSYESSGFNDWYLPSLEDIQLIYSSLNPSSLSSFSDIYHWSSSDHNEGLTSWVGNPVIGTISFANHSDLFMVRYIRSFSVNTLIIDSLQTELDEISNTSINAISSLQQALDTWNSTIDLSAGWNMFGYGCPSSIDVAEGLSNHTEGIIITKDNNGNVYMPEFGFNGIGDFTPGFGYQIKLTEAIEGFSLCDWYLNDIPEDNIVSLQEENASLQAELDSIYGCIDETACNYDETAFLDDGSCYNNDIGCGCDTPGPIEGYDCDDNELQYQLGGYAEGGIVFYLDETGEHGLVSALEDLTEGTTIDSEGNPGYQWGCFATGISGADGQAIGTGYQNTLDIASGCSETPIAASEALAYESEDYSDWYLPSLDELNEMYNTIGTGGSEGNIGGFSSNWYWSSSESNNYGAYDVNFGDGSTGNFSSKTKIARVRVIRSF